MSEINWELFKQLVETPTLNDSKRKYIRLEMTSSHPIQDEKKFRQLSNKHIGVIFDEIGGILNV